MSTAHMILNYYAPLINKEHSMFNPNEEEYILPQFNKSIIFNLFLEVQKYLTEVPTLVKTNGKTIIVGDIHGNIRDFIRIIRENGLPENITYVFLGDYVDRGEFSIEVLTLLFSLQVVYQEKIVILRGNHEVKNIGTEYGFAEEVQNCYGDLVLFEQAHEVFHYLSLAAVVNETFFCVHGGISNCINTLDKIAVLKKPIHIDNLKRSEKDMVNDMLWSDPIDSNVNYMDSMRGYGHSYGAYAVSLFFQETGMKRIVRGHTMVKKGIQFLICKSVITVFSSGYYNPSEQNRPGFLLVSGNECKPVSMHAIPQMQRKTTHFMRPVFCTTLAGLQSGRSIGPRAVNRYWSSRRSSLISSSAETLPPIRQTVSSSLAAPFIAGVEQPVARSELVATNQVKKVASYGIARRRYTDLRASCI